VPKSEGTAFSRDSVHYTTDRFPFSLHKQCPQFIANFITTIFVIMVIILIVIINIPILILLSHLSGNCLHFSAILVGRS